MSHSNPSRLTAIVVFCVATAWQVYVVVVTYVTVPTFEKLFSALGADLPPFTRFIFASYRWWFLIPVAFIALFVASLRRPQPSSWHFAAIIGGSLLIAFVLHASANVAVFGPMLALTKQIR
ncbi:MAG TPA: hypothetical protein VEZ11_00400 [Thermoanaerobaculia bacterium]|nr:hypothetical protein [Thermoanaerobaculia bacterium]